MWRNKQHFSAAKSTNSRLGFSNIADKLYSIIPYGVIALLGLVPLLWYKHGTVAAGHDMGYSFSPLERILGRLYVWSDAFNFGLDGSWNVGSIPIYLPEVLLESIGLPEQQVQMIVFIFWFIMPGIAMLYLLKTLAHIIKIPERSSMLFLLFGSIFYMFNHYLLQGWFVAAKSEFCLVIMTPFIIAFLLKVLFLKDSPVFYGLLSAVLLTFFNASGATGVALFGGLFVVFLWFFVYLLILHFKRFGYDLLKNYFLFTAVLVPAFLILNAYWILPFGYYAIRDYAEQFVGSGGATGILNWIDAVSKHATFANLFRLQGFAGWHEIENHPYSATYIRNPLFIAISFIFPSLFIYSFYLLKKIDTRTRVVIGFFFGLSLLTLFFMSGTRTPLSIVYQNFVKYLPGFAIFRSPFYKFGYVLWIAYGILIAFSLSHILTEVSEKIKNNTKKQIFKLSSGTLLVLIILIYSSPFFTGAFFVWNRPLSTMVTPPPYVFEFKEWMKTQDETRRILLYPPLPEPHLADAYKWNYWSLTPFPNLLSEKGIVSNNGFWSPRQKITIEQLYVAIERGDTEKVERLSKLLDISHVLFRRDVKTDLPWIPLVTTIDKYESIMQTAPWLSLEKTFGEWSLYSVRSGDKGKEFIAARYTDTTITDLGHLDHVMELFQEDSLYLLESDVGSAKFVLPEERLITAGCIGCDLEGEIPSYPTPVITLLPNSIFYKYTLFKEQVRLEREKTEGVRAVLKSSHAFRRVLELQKIIGGKVGSELTFEELALMVRVLNDVNGQLKEINAVRKESIQSEALNSESSKQIQAFINALRADVQRLKYALPRRNDIDEQFEEMTANLNRLQAITEKKLWITTIEDELKFVLQIPVDGDYSLSILTERHMNYDEIFQNDFQRSSALYAPDIQPSISAQRKIDNRFDFAKIGLHAGEYKMSLKVPPYKNVFTRKSIEVLPYGDPFITNIRGLNQNNRYLLDFDYNPESTHGISYKAIARLDNGQKIQLTMVRLTSNHLSHQKVLITTPSTLNRIEDVELTVEHSDLTALAFPLLLENITIHPLINPVLLARQENTQKIGEVRGNGIVESFQKVNPTLYHAEIRNASSPFYLTLNEGFSKNWHVYIMRDKPVNCTGFFCGFKAVIKLLRAGEKLQDARHVQSYGFSNAWFIDNNTEKDTLYVAFFYFPQVFAYAGFTITFIGFTGVSTLLVFLRVRKIRKL